MRETGDEERVSANWDVSSSQVSRQIGPVKPLKAGGGGRNTPRGVCVCEKRAFVCMCHSQRKPALVTAAREGLIRCARERM